MVRSLEEPFEIMICSQPFQMSREEEALTFWREQINVGAWGRLHGAGARWACTLRSDEGLHLSFCSHVQDIKRSSELAALGTVWG